MSATVNELTLVFHRWNKESGITEHAQVFPSLEALYDACLSAESTDLIDRVIISGQDGEGHERVITFVFQSVTVSSRR